ncbi:MAG: PilZ domain-containing protein [Chloroflexota bacterium]
MEERRKLKRRHIIYYLLVFDRDAHAVLGQVVDITPQGIMLISEQLLEVGRIYNLRLLLPYAIAGKRELLFQAHSKWCQKDLNPDFYDTGFQLLNVGEEEVRTIEWLIEQAGFRD